MGSYLKKKTTKRSVPCELQDRSPLLRPSSARPALRQTLVYQLWFPYPVLQRLAALLQASRSAQRQHPSSFLSGCLTAPDKTAAASSSGRLLACTSFFLVVKLSVHRRDGAANGVQKKKGTLGHFWKLAYVKYHPLGLIR